jgi:tetratricopeptide (TPR) repeat protein
MQGQCHSSKTESNRGKIGVQRRDKTPIRIDFIGKKSTSGRMEETVGPLVHEHARFDNREQNIRGRLEKDLEKSESPCEMAWSPSVSVGEEQQIAEVKARPPVVLCDGSNNSGPEISGREMRFFSPGMKDPASKTSRTRVPRGFSQGRKVVRPEKYQPPEMRGMNANPGARLPNYSNNPREGKTCAERTPERRRLVRPRVRTNATGARNQNEQINSDGRSRVAEELRNKGNESFKRCEYQQACTHYTGALHALRGIEGTQSASQAIALLYCNRAATYLALGRPYDALKDCREGEKIEPTYLKCAMRATTCLIRLGRFKEAREELSRMPSEQAMEKREEIDQCEGKMLGFLHSLGYDEVNGDVRDLEKNELQTLLAGYKEVQSLVPHSEALKGAIVDGHIRLCDYSTADRILDKILSQNGGIILPWMSWLRAQTCFYKADYKASIGNLSILEKLMLPSETFDSDLSMALKTLRVPDSEKLKKIIENLEQVEETKQQANEAFRGQQYQKATELYSKALRSGYLSPMMTAMLFSNRAAACSKIGDKVLAMADCCTSKSIIPVYIKVIC